MELVTRVENEIKLADEYIELIKAGKKISTIRPGIRLVTDETITFKSDKRSIKAKVTSIELKKKFCDITYLDAHNDGFRTQSTGVGNLDKLKQTLKSFYPDIQDNDRVTIIYFRYLHDSEILGDN